MAYHLRVTRNLPELGLVAGDVVLYDPSNLREPYTLYRAIPLDPGAILHQLNEGTIAPVDIMPSSVRPRSRSSAPHVLTLPGRDQRAG